MSVYNPWGDKPPTNTQLDILCTPLWTRSGAYLHVPTDIIATLVHYCRQDGYLQISRATGAWFGWYATTRESRLTSRLTPDYILLAFKSDYRRNAAQARKDLAREIDRLIERYQPPLTGDGK